MYCIALRPLLGRLILLLALLVIKLLSFLSLLCSQDLRLDQFQGSLSSKVSDSLFPDLLLVCSLGFLTCSGLEQYVAFDAASASSTYSAGNLVGSPAFTAQQALSGGSGYWFDRIRF